MDPERPSNRASTPHSQVELLHRLLIESVVDYAIFVLDPLGHVLSWNPGAERFKGYTADEIIGKHFSLFYPEDDVRAGKPAYELEEAARTGRFEDEGWRIRKDGSRFWANVVITALRDEAGQLVGYAKVTRDLTERHEREEQGRRLAAEAAARAEAERQAEELVRLAEQLQLQTLELEAQTDEAQNLTEELEQSNVELESTLAEAEEARQAAEEARKTAEEANEAKTRFLAVMSHELRTPLNAIAGYAELLRLGLRGPVTPQQAEDLDRITRSQRTLLSLINDILNFARLGAGQVLYASERVRLDEVLGGLEPMVSPQLGAKGLRLELPTCDPSLAALGDAEKVRQVLLNLLSNAIKFTQSGGTIGIRCEGDDGVVRVSVYDTGIGIAGDQLETIFEPFVQLDRTLTSGHEGSGLGLAISRDLARGMGGALTVESEPGRGATFVLSLPRAGA